MSNENMILIMIDECGDEIEVGRYTIGNDLDEDYLDIWKDIKIAEVQDSYPEARSFYFEDRRNWNAMINASLNIGIFETPWD